MSIINEVAKIIHRCYRDDGNDEAFLAGIQFASKINGEEWGRFESSVREELDRLLEESALKTKIRYSATTEAAMKAADRSNELLCTYCGQWHTESSCPSCGQAI